MSSYMNVCAAGIGWKIGIDKIQDGNYVCGALNIAAGSCLLLPISSRVKLIIIGVNALAEGIHAEFIRKSFVEGMVKTSIGAAMIAIGIFGGASNKL